ncbi:protocatechuate 3,4-dioxygenase beta subunit [Dactylonectria macrodidyma]|uniref:Protocatechuate 3,4-dioxygenase beta subunit n=1 Tax=Dactylonectria macrodidyma TaxID=307937 RepID=A0A9P9FSL7_9HYPO|nr:protocatechuate 3,4-dioxygenase beta subunit [Dactylonectria macrodidyma]
MKFFSSLLAASLLSAEVLAHPNHGSESPAILARHEHLSKRCNSHVAEFHKERYAEREQKRGLERRAGNTTYKITTAAPWFDVIHNDTCILSPEVTQGPYWWPRSVLLRQDMSEGESGVPLLLDIGVIDMATCEPLPKAMVSLWHCNATGSYSSFTGRSPDLTLGEQLVQLNITDFKIGLTDLHTDDTTFLRGMWPTNDNGIMEMKSIYPGFYAGRTIHIHIYFDSSLTDQLMTLEPYASHTAIERVTNEVDEYLPGSLGGGYNPYVSVVPMDGENFDNGVVGYITIGVDSEATA